MENQALIIENNLKTMVYKYASGFVHLVDMAVFKIVIDYIVRNFDPTGINIAGLIDSFYHVLIKPSLSSFYKIVKQGMNNYREFTITLPKSARKTKLISHQTFMLRHGCLK